MFRSAFNGKGILVLVLLLIACSVVLQATSYYFPHVANGMIGDSVYFTRFMITNGNTPSNQITMKFYQDSGAPWNVPVTSPDRQDISGTGNTFQFTLAASETVVINTVGDGYQLSAGWLSMSCLHPAIASSGFTFYRPDVSGPIVLADVGVLPSLSGTGFDMSVAVGQQEWTTGVDTNCGIAVCNPSAAAAEVDLILRGAGGQSTQTISLPAGGHTARFLTDLFPGVQFGDSFHGSLKIVSDVPVAPVALRVCNGLLSTLPVCPGEQRSAQQVQDWEPGIVVTLQGFPAVIRGTVELGSGLDTDSFLLNAVAGQILTIAPAAQGLGSTAAIDIELQNGSGQTLVTQTHGEGADPGAIMYPVTVNGSYFLIVRSAHTPSADLSAYMIFVDIH